MKREFPWIAGVLACAALLAIGSIRYGPLLLAQESGNGGFQRIARIPQPGGIIAADFDSMSSESVRSLIRTAAQTLANSPPLQAKLRYKIDMFGQRISGPGRYFQAGQGTGKTRIEFEFGFNEMAVQLHQFCDGVMLYNLTRAGDESTLEFVDLRHLNKLQSQMPDDARVASWLSIGSLTGLLNQLAEHFEFTEVESGQLDEIPVIHCTGTWRAAAVERLLQGQMDADAVVGNIVRWQKLPAHLPHQVSITLGNDQRFPWFPYRVVFEKFEMQNGEPFAHPVAVLELYEVRHAPELSDEMFQLPSLETPPTDATEFYEHRIRQFAR